MRNTLLLLLLLPACGQPVPSMPDGGLDPTVPSEDAGTQADSGTVIDAGIDAGLDAGPSEAARIAAATQTAQTNPACSLANLPEGFYWEIGDRNGLRASGTVTGTNTPTATQVIAVASSSKWVYASWVLETVGSVRPSDVPFLNFTSGKVFPITSLKEVTCSPTETVADCAAEVFDSPTALGRFYYGAGHFQHHAANVMGLGAMNAAALTTEVRTELGATDFRWLQTNIAGGLNSSAAEYAAFLRRLLRGEFVMSASLGSNKVCGSSACSSGAVLSPAPPDEAWGYSLGHWVEDDPLLGDNAFSSAGALGFYPWIDRTKTWYGVVARRAASAAGSQGVVSLRCGRLIRQAWVTGIAVSHPVPTP